MTEKRKLAAMLAADVVGFSRLTGTDEDARAASGIAQSIPPLPCTTGMCSSAPGARQHRRLRGRRKCRSMAIGREHLANRRFLRLQVQ